MSPLEAEARYERKVPVPGRDWQSLETRLKLHPLAFREAYPLRTVRNVYFDTLSMDYLEANRNGHGERKKVRVRWYGETADSPTLEIKRREGAVGRKWQHALRPLDPAAWDSAAYWERHLSAAALPGIFLASVAGVRPVLFNWYERRYYVSGDARFRVTIDTALGFRGVGQLAPAQTAPLTVLELKYAVEMEPEAYRVLEYLPHRADKHSKYVSGMEACFPEILR